MENMVTTKAVWEVHAGLIPGQPMKEFFRRFIYTSADYERDQQVPPNEMTLFTASMYAAHDYAKSLTDPRRVNWVYINWIWT
jgi:hypothetical protein